MIYRNKDGIILEVTASGEVFFNGKRCTLSKTENKYTICIDGDDEELDIIIDGNTFSFYNFKKFIKDTTLIIIDCVNEERSLKALNQCLDHCEFEDVKFLTSINSTNKYAVKINKINSIYEYSRFCIKELYKYVNTKYCLIIQHDGWIINGNHWNDAWYEWDYIGCQTIWTESSDEGKGGNGGVSFRSKKLLDLGKLIQDDNVHPEDTYISSLDTSKNGHRYFFEQNGCKIAPAKIQKLFGWEYGINHAKQFACHQSKLLLNYESETLQPNTKILQIFPDKLYSFGNFNNNCCKHLWGFKFDKNGFITTNHHDNEYSYSYLNTGELVLKNKNGFFTTIFNEKINNDTIIGPFAGGQKMYLKEMKNTFSEQNISLVEFDKKCIAWYICFGAHESEYTNISINSLLNIGKYKGDIVVITDVPHLFQNQKIKTIFLKSPQNIKQIWNSKYIIKNFIDINNYNICLYSDSDILFTKNINFYLNENINVLHNEYQYIVGSSHDSAGGQVLSKTQISEYFDVSICAGLFFGGTDIISKILDKHNSITENRKSELHDQGVLIKILLEDYRDKVSYIKNTAWREYSDDIAFVHFSNTKHKMASTYKSLLTNNLNVS